MTLTTIILLVLALCMVQIFLQETSRFGFDLWGIVGNRDKQPEMSIVAARLDRAKNNMLETLPMFLGLAPPLLQNVLLMALLEDSGQLASRQQRPICAPIPISG